MKIAVQERFANGRQQLAVDPLAVAKPDFNLGRMDIDVHLLGREFKIEKRDRLPADHEQAAIGFAERVTQARSRIDRPPTKKNCPLPLDRL